MIKPMIGASKVKSPCLFFIVVIYILVFGVRVESQDIFMDSGPHQDTQFWVGPQAGSQGQVDGLSIESQGNASTWSITPRPEYDHQDLVPEVIIITPEIFLEEP